MAEEIQAPESVPTSTSAASDQPTFVDVPPTEPTIALDMAKEGESDRVEYHFLAPDSEIEKAVSSEEEVVDVRVATIEMTPDEAEQVKKALLRQAAVVGKEQLTQAAYNTVYKVAISVLPALIPTISWKKDTPKEYDALVHGLCKQALEFGFAFVEEVFSASKSIVKRCEKIIDRGSDGDLATPDGPVPEPAQ